LAAFVTWLLACGVAEPVALASAPTTTPQPGGPSESALVGRAAPDFTLPDLKGAQVPLAALRGKTVVLEWFNPGCPFVVASHGKGSLRDAARRHAANGVVWLAVNSGAPGKQGHAVDENLAAVEAWGMSHPVLRDETGVVGKAYGATNTPQMIVIDPAGVVRYVGAIDNAPDGEGRAPQGGSLVNWVDLALADLAAGRPVATPATKPYGCGVKYGP
jgi:peroxiredoxin